MLIGFSLNDITSCQTVPNALKTSRKIAGVSGTVLRRFKDLMNE